MFILTNGTIAIGPFRTRESAEKYLSLMLRVGYQIMEILEPEDYNV